jgi:deoxyribodipyrimidine photo-lyase
MRIEKYDPDYKYIHKRIDEFGTDEYPDKMIDHKKARKWTIEVYKKTLND